MQGNCEKLKKNVWFNIDIKYFGYYLGYIKKNLILFKYYF